MLQMLSKKSVLLGSFIFMITMFSVVMFVVNPLIDRADGLSVIALQLSFQKEAGIEIINSWGETGVSNFRKWIFTDYLYAISYSLFLGSLLSWLIIKKGKESFFVYTWGVYLVFIAGGLDCIENTIEICFVNNPIAFSSMLFFLHSIVASLKWCAVPIATVFILILFFQDNKKDSVGIQLT